jgi:SRSO17 transposase
MNEKVPNSNYEQQQHFLSESTWNSSELMREIALSASKSLQTQGLVSCTVDEKSHSKKGKSSAGVAPQYSGNKGKVENCQVGVYLSLCAQKYAAVSNKRLFLPEVWTNDRKRCQKAGILDDVSFKTKPQLALEMIEEHLQDGVHFDYVNGDGLYGNSYELSKGFEKRSIPYVLDIHSTHRIFPEKPRISVPEKKPGTKGRRPTRLKADKEGIKASDYVKGLQSYYFKKVKIHRTTKGWLKAKIHVANVWVWDEAGGDTEPIQQTLIYRKPIKKGDREKYSLSNIHIDCQSPQLFGFMQAQRFWIEKVFRDDSHDLGMSDYQVQMERMAQSHGYDFISYAFCIGTTIEI